jgi:hypothetical protein
MVNYSDSTKMLSETDIIKMLDFLIALTILKYLFCLVGVFFNRQLIFLYGYQLYYSSRQPVPLIRLRASPEKL